MVFDNILPLLSGVKSFTYYWTARCPGHNDHNQSLSISIGEDSRILLHCFAGCSTEKVVSSLGLTMKDLFPNGNGNGNAHKAQIRREFVKAYDYTYESGNLFYQVVRYLPKDFRQRRPDGKGGWIYNLKGISPLLYRLPQLVRSVRDNRSVFIAEGEEDVLNLERLGFAATCNSGGAGKFPPGMKKYFTGARVVILPDKDEPGDKHAQQVASMLYGVASEIRILRLPGIPQKGDVSDWIQSGGTGEQLIALAKDSPLWKPISNSVPEVKPEFSFTDLGDAECIAEKYGDEIMYLHEPFKRWYIWNGKLWEPDCRNKIFNFAALIARNILHEAGDCSDGEQRKILTSHARKLESLQKQKNTIGMLQTLQKIQISLHDLDQGDFLLNTLNGTIDLHTGTLRPHERTDLLTRLAPVEYHPGVQSRTWNDFLETVLPDLEVRRYVQKAAGYSLSGDISEEKSMFAYGPPATGKSTFLGAIQSVLGEYAITTDFTSFLASRLREGGARSDIAGLAKYRFVCSIEVEDGQKMAEGLLCILTGGDRVRARFLYHESFEYKPSFKIWFAANNRPDVSSGESALWRRLKLLPFDRVIPENKRDPKIKKILHDPSKSGSAILSWLVDGCLLWQKEGLRDEPEAVKVLTEEYRHESDPLREFLDMCSLLSGINVHKVL